MPSIFLRSMRATSSEAPDSRTGSFGRWHDEDRAAHREHPDQAAIVVQGLLETGGGEARRPGSSGQEGRCRIGAVQRHDGRRRSHDVRIALAGKSMSAAEPAAALVVVERLHGADATARRRQS
ncbi:hypothetical protein [Aeromicrobium sp. UC242_57]|uniref:hypothetical protein n=1 Tax=Aeromicrobium sp. UC242_57 TaxID=3374624 RepID=UPI0037AC90E5